MDPCLVCYADHLPPLTAAAEAMRRGTDPSNTFPTQTFRFTWSPSAAGRFTWAVRSLSPAGGTTRAPRRVELKPFWMGKYEVAWPEFYAYMREKDFDITDKPLRPALNPRQAKADAVSKPTKPYIDETYGFGADCYPAFDGATTRP